MQELVYALQFLGQAQQVGPDGNVFRTMTSAAGCTSRANVTAAGLHSHWSVGRGDRATLESEVVLTGASTFQESGTIAFGVGEHRLRFSTIGSGHISGFKDGAWVRGASIWRIDSGDGQFAGARGSIVSNFVITVAGEVTQHQLGMILVRQTAER